ncbi:MAG: aldehyde dehydrogenase family protein, partial [Bdellovibrionota bacterium]
MSKPKFKFKYLGNYISGKFVMPGDPNGDWISRAPGDATDEIARVQYSYASVNEAIQSSRDAFRSWRKTPIAARAELLKRYQTSLKKREEELTEAIAREVGKPIWESKTEVAAMLGKIDITINEGMKPVSDYEVPAIMENTRGTCHYKPLGVMAVLGPFNFPGHLPNGHIVPAIMTGNTVIFKPSEKSPIVGQIVAECFQDAGFPSGVFNLIQGEKEVGRRLSIHEGIDGVLFTGSYEVGTRIKQDTLQQHWKLLALEMGGKNSAIVWDDSNLDVAIAETLFGAYVTAGQRCSATSRIIVQRRVLDKFIEQFHQRAKGFKIGNPLEDPFMGPLIEARAVDRYMKFLGIAVREGCEMIMRGKALELESKGNYVTPSICWVKETSLDATKKSVYQQTELFAPNVAILAVDEIEEAI